MRILFACLLVVVFCLGCSRAAQPSARKSLPDVALGNARAVVRPVEAETLRFASPLLKERFDALLAQFDEGKVRWQVEPLALHWHRAQPGRVFYTAKWSRALEPDADWRALSTEAIAPQRMFQLSMSPVRGEQDRIGKVAMMATYGPPHNGWAAHVSYELAAVEGRDQEAVTILFSHNQQHVDELPASKWQFFVPHTGVVARHRAANSRIEFLARPTLSQTVYQQQLLAALAAPESLRDLELKLCDELEATLRQMIDKGQVNFIDYTNVRSDNPPREAPLAILGATSITDQAKAALLADGLAQLNRRRHRWRTQAEQLHTAAGEAFPLLIDWAAERQEANGRSRN